jgi:hypothetical protein
VRGDTLALPGVCHLARWIFALAAVQMMRQCQRIKLEDRFCFLLAPADLSEDEGEPSDKVDVGAG